MFSIEKSIKIIVISSLVFALALVACAPKITETPAPVESEVVEEKPEEEEQPATSEEKEMTAEELVAQLPEDIQSLYANNADPIFPSAYTDFTPPAQPWKVCFADSYGGNPWRVANETELKRLTDELVDQGATSGFELSVSDNDIALQISQVLTFIEKDCSIIFTTPATPDGLNDAIKEAFDAGIPVVTVGGASTSPYAINVNGNFYWWAYDMMSSCIYDTLGDNINILMVEGLPGNSLYDSEGKAADDFLAEHPNINVAARVDGEWTLSVTKSAVTQALATSSGEIDAVWTTGSEARVVSEAFEEAGLPQPLITSSLTGDILGYWNANKDDFKFCGHGILPDYFAQTSFKVGMRLLSGQNPKLSYLMYPLPSAKPDELVDWYEDCMTPESTSIFPIPPFDPWPEEVINQYFVDGKATGLFDYSKVPSPCEGK